MSDRRTLAKKLRLAAVPLGLVVAAAACGSGGGGYPTSSPSPSQHPPGAASPSTPGSNPSPGAPGTPPPARSPHASPPPQAASCVDRVMNGMTAKQRVGQLFMSAVGASGATGSELDVLRRNDVGSVILMGHTDNGVRGVRSVTDRVQTVAPTVAGARVGMLVSADQEGGQVQVLNGPGFSAMPSAVTQGQWPTPQLQQNAAAWGKQLRAAGVNVDLAPVTDVVPPALTSVNEPIGKLSREYGTNAPTVSRQTAAVVRGFDSAGVYATLKHFPSLGEVRGNTDFSPNVTDDVTPRNGTFVTAYRGGIDAGARFVMASLATYTKIDPNHQSVFSSVLLRDVLRQHMGFRGVVISDDLGRAVAVQSVPAGQRATGFVGAGGDLVLTVAPSTVDAMASAVLSKANQDPSFRAQVDASAHRVLTAKADAGLLRCGS